MAKGQLSPQLVMFVIAIVVLLVLLTPVGKLSAQTINPLLHFRDDALGKDACDEETVKKDTVENNIDLVRRYASEKEDEYFGITEIAVKVARRESTLKHCRGEGEIVSSGRSVGLMQIEIENPRRESTAEATCPDLDVYNREENVECGIRVLTSKFDAINNYEACIEENCGNDRYKSHYLSYEKGWEKALKLYHGCGCGEGADICYVENVLNRTCPFR